MKIFFRRIHLYLSLAAGIPILIACLTGAILVFEKDLEKAFNKERYYVTASDNKLPLEDLKTAAVQAFPGTKLTGIKIYAAADRSAELNLSPAQKENLENKKEAQAQKSKAAEQKGQQGPQAGRGHGGPPAGFTVFMDPYSGKVLEKYSYRETFFFQVMALHRWLLGSNDSWGKWIMGVATFIFMFILITGIILWWPRTQRIMLKQLKIKKDAGFKRLNHDLHIVLGFYSAIFLFIFAFTAMSWSFEWFNKSLYSITNSSPNPPEAPKSDQLESSAAINLDEALAAAKSIYDNAEWYQVAAPKDLTESFTVSVLLPDAAHENATSSVYIDQASGAVLGNFPFDERSSGQKARSFIKPLHTGSIWGMPSKIVAFVVCVLGVSFPVTGFIMWRNRTRKKPNLARRVAKANA